MPDIAEIQKFADWIFDTYNSTRISGQETDQQFYDDEFPVPGIVAPFHVVRTGSAARIIDNMVAHIETANPKVFRDPNKQSEKSKESAIKVSKFLNYYVQKLIDEITESVWCAAKRGEAVFQVGFNRDAYSKKGKDYVYNGTDLPVTVTAIDPITVCCYPYDALVPARVAKRFDIDGGLIPELFPNITLDTGKKNYSYTAYYDALNKYFSVDRQDIEGGVQRNILRFCPFVHFYGGFGSRSASGKPETMAVSRLRKLRGRLQEECEIESRIDSIIGLYANPILKIEAVAKDASEIDRRELEKIVLGPGANVVVPYGYKAEIYTPDVATAQLFAHLGQIKGALGLEDPPIMSGASANSRVSGRQEDIEFGHHARKYVKLIKNAEVALSAVMSMVLRILYEQPQALPISLKGETIKSGQKVIEDLEITKDDIDGYFECTVRLDPEEELENDRRFMKYRMLRNEGHISEREFQVKGLGKTEDEADESIAEFLAEQSIMNNPMARAARDEEAIEQMGMQRYVEKTKQNARMQQMMAEDLRNYQPTQGKARPSEAANPAALETVRRLLGGETPIGQRNSPAQTPAGAA